MRVCLESTFLSRAISRRLRTPVERLRASTRKKRGPALHRPSFRNQQVAGSSPAAGSRNKPAAPITYELLGGDYLAGRFWTNSVWLLATLVGAVAITHYVVIPREEQYLERRFGAQYLRYTVSVRRWL